MSETTGLANVAVALEHDGRPDINAAEPITRVPDVPLSSHARSAIASRSPAQLTTDEQLQLAAEAQRKSLATIKGANETRDILFRLAAAVKGTVDNVRDAQLALDAVTSCIAAGLQAPSTNTGEVWVLVRHDEEQTPSIAVVGMFESLEGAQRAALNWQPLSGWQEKRRSDAVARPTLGTGWIAELTPARLECNDRSGARLILERQMVTR